MAAGGKNGRNQAGGASHQRAAAAPARHRHLRVAAFSPSHAKNSRRATAQRAAKKQRKRNEASKTSKRKKMASPAQNHRNSNMGRRKASAASASGKIGQHQWRERNEEMARGSSRQKRRNKHETAHGNGGVSAAWRRNGAAAKISVWWRKSWRLFHGK